MNNSINNTKYEQKNINTPIMPKYEFPTGINTLCIKATVGIGKTNTLYQYLEANLKRKYKSCLIISFRRILCKKYKEELPLFTNYEQISDSEYDSSKYPFLICQVDSIKKIRGQYDLIVFDEISSTLSHLISSVDSKKRCFDLLREILYDNNKIICMDALLDEDWINYIKSFNRNICYINNTYSIHTGKKIFNYGNNITGFEKEIRKSIEKGENIVIASNNKKLLNYIDTMIINNYKNTSKLFINKETKNMYDLKQWKNVQVLGYTPTIVSGISFTEKHFDKCFGLFCNTSATADMAFQQLFRVRDISKGEYHICCKITGKNDYPVKVEDIKKLILKEDKCLLTGLDNVTINYLKKDIVEDEYFRLYLLVQKNRFLCNNNYNDVLINHLKEQGISDVKNINEFDINDKKSLLKNIKEFNRQVEEEEAERTANALDVTEDEIQYIKDNKNKTEDERHILYKHKNKKVLKIETITKEVLLKFSKKGKPLWNLAYIYGYEDFNNQLLTRISYDEKRIDNSNDITTRLGRNRKYEKMFLCNHILNYLGFNGPLDTKNMPIDKNKFRDYIIKYSDIIESYFACNKFDIKIFDKDVKEWYKIAKIYINSKLRSIYNISIIDNKKENTWFIKGLEIWDDVVNYNNESIIYEIKENERKLFEKIDNNGITIRTFNDDEFADILNNMSGVTDVKKTEEFHYDVNSPLDYINEYNNKLCTICNTNKYSSILITENIKHCDDCHWATIEENQYIY